MTTSRDIRGKSLKKALATGVFLVGMAGCGGLDIELAPVEGTVTMDGQPVADAGILFTPKQDGKGPSASAATDNTGHFMLMTANRPGAVMGEHVVVISKSELLGLPRLPDGKIDETKLHEVKELTEAHYLPCAVLRVQPRPSCGQW